VCGVWATSAQAMQGVVCETPVVWNPSVRGVGWAWGRAVCSVWCVRGVPVRVCSV